jgi:hypothetical protein
MLKNGKAEHEDRSKDYDEIMNHFLTTMKTYEFEEWVDEDEEE